ncbi:DUF6728 family protein [Rhodoflexus sp.]
MAQEPFKREKNTLSDYLSLGPMLGYFMRVFKKDGGSSYSNFNLRMMHGINRISILMFLFCVIVLIVRRLFM